MKKRLNLTIDNTLLEKVKRYAEINRTSLSELTEGYFKHLERTTDQKTIIDLVDKLNRPSIPARTCLKKGFYEGRAKRYGF